MFTFQVTVSTWAAISRMNEFLVSFKALYTIFLDLLSHKWLKKKYNFIVMFNKKVIQ